MRFRLERNLDLGIAASRRRSHHRSDAIRMLPDAGSPCTAGENDECDATYLPVLLVADPSIGGEQQLEASFLSSVQQRAVACRDQRKAVTCA